MIILPVNFCQAFTCGEMINFTEQIFGNPAPRGCVIKRFFLTFYFHGYSGKCISRSRQGQVHGTGTRRVDTGNHDPETRSVSEPPKVSLGRMW